MVALIIEASGEVKEAFSYERPLSEASHRAVFEYARANYGPSALVRGMTLQEERDFISHGADYFKSNHQD